MRPTMTMTYEPTTNKPAFDLSGTLGTLIRFAIIAAVVLGLGYLFGDSLGLWDLTAGDTITTIQERHEAADEVLEMLRPGG